MLSMDEAAWALCYRRGAHSGAASAAIGGIVGEDLLMKHTTLAVVLLALAAAPTAASGPGPCDGRYQGLLTVKSARGASAAEMQWTVRDTKLFGGFEGPSGLFMVEATIDAGCRIVAGTAHDYAEGSPMPVIGTVTEGVFRHNGPIDVSYRMNREP